MPQPTRSTSPDPLFATPELFFPSTPSLYMKVTYGKGSSEKKVQGVQRLGYTNPHTSYAARTRALVWSENAFSALCGSITLPEAPRRAQGELTLAYW